MVSSSMGLSADALMASISSMTIATIVLLDVKPAQILKHAPPVGLQSISSLKVTNVSAKIDSTSRELNA